MSNKNPLRRVLSELLPLVAVVVTAVTIFGLVKPASAQFFLFGEPRRAPAQSDRGGSRGFPFFAPFQTPQPQQSRPTVDYSKAPAPEKRETVADYNILVLGDAMADWLASGLEDAFFERPELGVIRKGKHLSGLIRYQTKGEPTDWAAAAREILPTENPAMIVVMLGLNDRMPIREPEESDKKDTKSAAGKGRNSKNGTADSAKPDDEKAAEAASDSDKAPSSIIAEEKSGPSANGAHEFRSERWVELYSKKIDEMIAIVKSRGVPVLWVGLPAVRGKRSMADTLFLDSLYRDAAGRAGITYVDVWDGFVDEAGRFLRQGPDFEGQIRRLRTPDGVYFTKAGARKLAHYVDREIQRLLARGAVPLNLPNEPLPEASLRPGGLAPRPLAGPVIPLVASSVSTNQLLGGAGSPPPPVDALASRTMVKGEPLEVPAGRADDFSWPRREVGRIELAKEIPIASAPPKEPAAAQKQQQRPRSAPTPAPSASSGFFGFGQRAQQQQSQQRTRASLSPPPPRPPADIGPPNWLRGLFGR